MRCLYVLSKNVTLDTYNQIETGDLWNVCVDKALCRIFMLLFQVNIGFLCSIVKILVRKTTKHPNEPSNLRYAMRTPHLFPLKAFSQLKSTEKILTFKSTCVNVLFVDVLLFCSIQLHVNEFEIVTCRLNASLEIFCITSLR